MIWPPGERGGPLPKQSRLPDRSSHHQPQTPTSSSHNGGEFLPKPLLPLHMVCHDEIRAAADEGRQCPSNDRLLEVSGYESSGTPCRIIQRLQEHGLLRCQSFQRGRLITFPDGASTAPPQCRQPHWRERRRGDDIDPVRAA